MPKPEWHPPNPYAGRGLYLKESAWDRGAGAVFEAVCVRLRQLRGEMETGWLEDLLPELIHEMETGMNRDQREATP